MIPIADNSWRHTNHLNDSCGRLFLWQMVSVEICFISTIPIAENFCRYTNHLNDSCSRRFLQQVILVGIRIPTADTNTIHLDDSWSRLFLFFVKEPLIIGLFCRKRPIKMIPGVDDSCRDANHLNDYCSRLFL